MEIRVDVWSDFVCPWCFLASTSLEKLKESHGVEVVWRSYELRPKGAPPMPPEYQAHILATRPRFEAMAWEVYGVEIHGGPLGVDSRLALIGHKYAEGQGVGDRYHDAMFRAYWQQAQSIDELPVLREVAVSVGLDGDTFLEALQEPIFEQQVLADIYQAQRLGLSGVPAMIFDRKYLVSGAQPYDVLTDVVEQIQAQNSARTVSG